MSKTKVDVEGCPRCGRHHIDYTIKQDVNKAEYVVCGITHKKMPITIHSYWVANRREVK